MKDARQLIGSYEHSICPRGHFITPGSVVRNPINFSDQCRPCIRELHRESERRRRFGLRTEFSAPDVPVPQKLGTDGRKFVRRALAEGTEPWRLAHYFGTSLSEIHRATMTSDIKLT